MAIQKNRRRRADSAASPSRYQAAWYLDGLATLAPRRRRFLWLAVEKRPPHCVRVLEPEEPDLEEGRRQYRRALDAYADSMRTGEWPGYPVGIDPINLPRWGYEMTSPDF